MSLTVVLTLFFRLVMFYEDYGIIFEWVLLRCNSINIELLVYVDWLALLFIRFIFMISSLILLYRYEYMRERKFLSRFIYLVILFIFSMILMIFSPRIIRILFGWDGLGLVSYCLIIYYQNYMSYNSGIVTVLCNRIGDVGLLLCVALIIVKGRWNIWRLGGKDILIIFILFLAAITKRAQLPFSPWLPIAIAAPTPVSALVHSSTLVTAGVYLIIRFNRFLLVRGGLREILFFLSVVTIFMAGGMAIVENDLKKIIALSTLRQLGLIIIILSIGYEILAFYHLLTHAIFKSILFICAGIIIHSINDNQDIRLFGSLNEILPFTIIRFLVSRLALCGFPFLAGFYSKDFIIELIYINEINGLMLVIIVLSLSFTVIYSFRLFYYLFYRKIIFKRSFYSLRERRLINFSIIILVFFRISIGALLNWLFFFDYYYIFLRFDIKIVTVEICTLGLFLGIMISLYNFLKKYYYLGYFLSSMIFLTFLYRWVIVPVNKLGRNLYEGDKSWFEFSIKNLVIFLSRELNKGVIMYKIYMYLIILIGRLIIIILIF